MEKVCLTGDNFSPYIIGLYKRVRVLDYSSATIYVSDRRDK